MVEAYTRAGFPMHTTVFSGAYCGGCGADIDPGDEHGYSGGMCICVGCIEVFEEEDAATNDAAMLQMAKQEEEEN